MISSNETGVLSTGAATVRLRNTDSTLNNSGISGTTLSYGNNRVLGNIAPGTAPTPAGAASGEFGQQ